MVGVTRLHRKRERQTQSSSLITMKPLGSTVSPQVQQDLSELPYAHIEYSLTIEEFRKINPVSSSRYSENRFCLCQGNIHLRLNCTTTPNTASSRSHFETTRALLMLSRATSANTDSSKMMAQSLPSMPLNLSLTERPRRYQSRMASQASLLANGSHDPLPSMRRVVMS